MFTFWDIKHYFHVFFFINWLIASPRSQELAKINYTVIILAALPPNPCVRCLFPI